jgi:hypothetical protein
MPNECEGCDWAAETFLEDQEFCNQTHEENKMAKKWRFLLRLLLFKVKNWSTSCFSRKSLIILNKKGEIGVGNWLRIPSAPNTHL